MLSSSRGTEAGHACTRPCRRLSWTTACSMRRSSSCRPTSSPCSPFSIPSLRIRVNGVRTVEVTDELQAYLDGLLPLRDPVLARMEAEARSENIPIVDAHEGALLYLLVKIAGAK